VLLSSYMTDNGLFDHNLLTNCFSNRENAVESQAKAKCKFRFT
jgi:hypothetical protein